MQGRSEPRQILASYEAEPRLIPSRIANEAEKRFCWRLWLREDSPRQELLIPIRGGTNRKGPVGGEKKKPPHRRGGAAAWTETTSCRDY